MTKQMSGEQWLTAKDALEILEPRYGAQTKDLIADKLKDGLMRAKADLVWDSSEPSLNAAWKRRNKTLENEEEAEVERDSEIDSWLWQSSRHWAFDLANWRWQEDRFVITRRKKPADRSIIEGLKLLKSDVVELAKPPSKRGGRKPKYRSWAHLFCVLLEVDRSGRLTLEQFPKRSALEREVLNAIASLDIPQGERLEDETMTGVVNAVWDCLIETEQLSNVGSNQFLPK